MWKIVEGKIERIGLPEVTFGVKGLKKEDNFSKRVAAPDHTAAVTVLIDWIEEQIWCNALTATGHRVVHGGPKYSEWTMPASTGSISRGSPTWTGLTNFVRKRKSSGS